MYMYTPSEFGKRIHVSVKTLQRWDRQGVFKAHRTATNRRYYTQEDLLSIFPQEAGARRRMHCLLPSIERGAKAGPGKPAQDTGRVL